MKWRAKDKHTGIDTCAGYHYTYEHIATEPTIPNHYYRIETYIPFIFPTPLHKNVYYVPTVWLNEFCTIHAQCGERIVSIQQLTKEQARKELRQFRLKHGQ